MLGMRFQPFLTDTSSLQIWFNIFPVEALAMYGGYYPPLPPGGGYFWKHQSSEKLISDSLHRKAAFVDSKLYSSLEWL